MVASAGPFIPKRKVNFQICLMLVKTLNKSWNNNVKKAKESKERPFLMRASAAKEKRV